MADTNQQGAKPAAPQAASSNLTPTLAGTPESSKARFERYAVGFAQAMLTAKPGATPQSLAKQVMDFTEKFIEALDSRNAK